MPPKPPFGNAPDPQILALQALVWTIGDDRRAQRLLDLTGLDADGLRAGAGDTATLGAVLGFLASHEPDLIACAGALNVAPADLIAAQEALA